MKEKRNVSKPDTLAQRLQEKLAGQKQGFSTKIDIGEHIFPYALPPQLEIVLLDPEENTLAYRPASSPESKFPQKKGDWMVGQAEEALDYVASWTKKMLENK